MSASPPSLVEVVSAQLHLGATDDAAATLDRAVAAADEIGSKRLRWRQCLASAGLQRAVGNDAKADRERAAYFEERTRIMSQVPGPDRESFDMLIAAVAERALRSDR